jgi:restriction system protein
VPTPLPPKYHELILPTLRAVERLGGSGSITEIEETVVKNEGYSDEQLAILHNNGPSTEISYRLAWARTYLKGMGLLTNSARGVWALTDAALHAQPISTVPSFDPHSAQRGDGVPVTRGVIFSGQVSTTARLSG